MKQCPTWFDVYLVNVKSSGRLFQSFVAFSECPNFNTFHRNILNSFHTNIDKLELEIFWQFYHKIPLSFSMVSLWKTDVDISSLLEKFECLDLGLVSLKNRQIKILLKHFTMRWYIFYWSIFKLAIPLQSKRSF